MVHYILHSTYLACSLKFTGEITIPSLAKFNTRYHVAHNQTIHFITNNSSKSANFHVPWTKTTKEDGADIIVTARDNKFDSVEAIRRHLFTNAAVPGTFSLFAYIDIHGKPKHMVKKTFLDFCSDVWTKAAMNHVMGHSWRIGGVVALLLAGVDPNIVAGLGGWKSLAFLLYWRRMEDVIPLHIRKAYETESSVELGDIIKRFQKLHKITDKLIDSYIAGEDFLDANTSDI